MSQFNGTQQVSQESACQCHPRESDTLNNFMVDGTLKKCGLQGDVNKDGVVNLLDLARVGAAFGSSLGDLNYDADADLNKDGAVNLLDLVLIGANLQKSCTS